MNEITLRRAFLDRRSCTESTLKLDYEKEQEVTFRANSLLKISFKDFIIMIWFKENLMLSILPKYIAARVSKDIRDTYEQFSEETRLKGNTPFK
jgi:adenylate cyclase